MKWMSQSTISKPNLPTCHLANLVSSRATLMGWLWKWHKLSNSSNSVASSEIQTAELSTLSQPSCISVQPLSWIGLSNGWHVHGLAYCFELIKNLSCDPWPAHTQIMVFSTQGAIRIGEFVKYFLMSSNVSKSHPVKRRLLSSLGLRMTNITLKGKKKNLWIYTNLRYDPLSWLL